MYLLLLMIFLISGFDEWGKGCDEILEKVLWVCKQVNLKLNKIKCIFSCTTIPSFYEIISHQNESPDLKKTSSTYRHATTKDKKGLESFLSSTYYLIKLSPMTSEVYEPLQKLTSVKTGWPWNRVYQDLYGKAKKIVKKMHEVL